jgi:hypothetical protein
MEPMRQTLKKQKSEQKVCSCGKPQIHGQKHECTGMHVKIEDFMSASNEFQSSDFIKPKRLEWFVAENATVLHINTQYAQAAKAAISVMQVAERVIGLYSCVGEAATDHGIPHVEYRNNSFVCVIDLDDPCCAGDPVRKLLAFAADLRQRLANLTAPVQAHMGMASGATTLIRTPLAVIGGPANIAEGMARLEIPAAVAMHDTALRRRTVRLLPALPPVECAGEWSRQTAVFDFGTCSFRPADATVAVATPKLAAVPSPFPPSVARGLRRSVSFA